MKNKNPAHLTSISEMQDAYKEKMKNYHYKKKLASKYGEEFVKQMKTRKENENNGAMENI